MSNPEKPAIAFAPPSLASNPEFVAKITNLINAVYLETESDFFLGSVNRVSTDEVHSFIRSGELAICWRAGSTKAEASEVMGCIKTSMLNGQTGQFGLLACDPAFQGTGVGWGLIRFAEEFAKNHHGAERMQLELLFPRDWHHPFKTRLADWYGRAGYELVRSVDMVHQFPQIAPALAKPADFRVYQKKL
ncbi:hypothetical protein B0H66DRAFT_269406 [Apodospora peruviana]|uniref:N-acetyltransferase domain-containing protein n=1 Tax=Apodospora peruviana TaxID=516989 RepID=A0AAE0M2N0_9PEZI|nr:hypothetical protein B0H66DRAFT_269406 [Apodospora peruviana]